MGYFKQWIEITGRARRRTVLVTNALFGATSHTIIVKRKYEQQIFRRVCNAIMTPTCHPQSLETINLINAKGSIPNQISVFMSICAGIYD